MSITYRNTITGRVVERESADRLMDRSQRWERIEPKKRPVEPYNPSEHGVHEVNEYLASASPDERKRVLTAEVDDKARSTILNGPYGIRE